MKRLLLLPCLALACLLTVQAQERQVYILHTSDTHSRIEPIDPQAADPNAGQGGIVRRSTLVKAFRQEHPGTLLLDCGDFSQGTPYYNMFQGELEVRAMNLMGYDAATIGNHEFDFGLDNMARLYRLATFPVVCANYDVTGTVLEGLVQPYVVLEREGVRIGIFGLGPKLEGLVQADKCAGIVYSDPSTAAQAVTDRLRDDEHCDLVICLSHLGILRTDEEDVNGEFDNTLARRTHGIDLILGGHTHTYMDEARWYDNATGQAVPVMHIGKSGVQLSQTCLTLEPTK